MPEEKKPREVWMTCRGKKGCEGKIAVVVFQKNTQGGGSVSRYRCKTCGSTWHVQV